MVSVFRLSSAAATGAKHSPPGGRRGRGAGPRAACPAGTGKVALHLDHRVERSLGAANAHCSFGFLCVCSVGVLRELLRGRRRMIEGGEASEGRQNDEEQSVCDSRIGMPSREGLSSKVDAISAWKHAAYAAGSRLGCARGGGAGRVRIRRRELQSCRRSDGATRTRAHHGRPRTASAGGRRQGARPPRAHHEGLAGVGRRSTAPSASIPAASTV